jgi:hypothetical protein
MHNRWNLGAWERHSLNGAFGRGKANLLAVEFWHTLLEKRANAFAAIL